MSEKSFEGAVPEVSAKQIFGLAFPALGVLAAMPLYLLLDTAVVGTLGGFELAALGAATTIQAQVTTQLTFLSYGTTARSSRIFGTGNRAGAIAEGVQATWVALFVGLGILTVMLIGAPTFAMWLSGDEQVASEAAHWLRVAAFAVPLVLIIMAGNGWLRGIQNTKLPLYFTLSGVIPGAIMIPIFVAKFGLVGSAWANLVAEAITAALFLGALLKHHQGSWAPDWKVMKNQLVLGRDLIMRSLSFQVAFLSAAAVAARFGTASLAAHQVLLQLWNFITLVLDSLAIAAQTLTGAALGAGSARIARRVGNQVIKYSLVFAAGLGIIFLILHSWIPRIFTQDTAVLEAISSPWWIMVAMIILGGIVFAIDGVLLGASDAVFLRNASVLAVVLGFLPGVWISYAVDAGLTGVWCGLLAFILIRLFAVIWRFQSMKWAH
ncbi:DNA-damage-inducible membrane protein [Corynebacterium suranareeae]|uniref:DNA-damage-inducible membrane protein n=1 Tax=Corynebacterium suranareeae TaxID=2506452 RepID=A0A160PRU4_9CORY|nr:MATE family efflux transporter [Corynebacterium suranareeae]BAU96315.1 DNA-damage-inducible membrane protein [Corynebacterium suranareeae]